VVEPTRFGSRQDPLAGWLKRCRHVTRRWETSPSAHAPGVSLTASAEGKATGSRVENTSDAVG
jgi:hypothetical protein